MPQETVERVPAKGIYMEIKVAQTAAATSRAVSSGQQFEGVKHLLSKKPLHRPARRKL